MELLLLHGRSQPKAKKPNPNARCNCWTFGGGPFMFSSALLPSLWQLLTLHNPFLHTVETFGVLFYILVLKINILCL